jgi:hypothetical protein
MSRRPTSPAGGADPVDPGSIAIEIAAGAWQLLPLTAADLADVGSVLPTQRPGEWLAQRSAVPDRCADWTIRAAVGGAAAGWIGLDVVTDGRGRIDLGLHDPGDPAHQEAGRIAVAAVERYAAEALGIDTDPLDSSDGARHR